MLGRENRTKEAAMTRSECRRPGEGRMLNRAAPLMAKVLATCGDGEWRTVNAIAERTGLSVESARGVIKNIRRRRQATVERQRRPLPASLAGGAGARPDHAISGHLLVPGWWVTEPLDAAEIVSRCDMFAAADARKAV